MTDSGGLSGIELIKQLMGVLFIHIFLLNAAGSGTPRGLQRGILQKHINGADSFGEFNLSEAAFLADMGHALAESFPAAVEGWQFETGHAWNG